jgi:hypothetical protein
MKWMVIYEYEVSEEALNLSSTELPRPWSPWESSPSRKDPHGRTGNRTRDLMIRINYSLTILCTICKQPFLKFFVSLTVLLRVKGQRSILHEISKRKANWIGLVRRNCLLRQVIEVKIKGGIKVTGRRGRRRKRLLVTLRNGKDTRI